MTVPLKSGVTFRQMITGGQGFYYGAELVTTRGLSEPGKPSKLIETAQALAADSRIGWISATDNAGGNPMLPPDWLARILATSQCQVVVHLTCKDLNRNGLESAAWRLASEGFENILALTGDYPAGGFRGLARPAYDLDSVSLIAMLAAMNQGMQIPGRKGEMETLPRTNFFIGAAASPFKRHERELLPQYFKLARKLRCGAQWVIPQLGYDMRKFHELMLFMQWAKLSAPLIGNVYLLSKGVAGVFHRNQIPGCVVSSQLKELCDKHGAGPDKGAAFFIELAAKQLAAFHAMGYAAGYLAGIAKPETFYKIIDLAQSYSHDDGLAFAKEIQYPQSDEFYLFEQDPQTGLGIPGKLSGSYVESLKSPPKTANVSLGYRLGRKVHSSTFTPGKKRFERLQKFYAKHDKDGKPAGALARAADTIERVSKTMGYGCKDCGDCSLPDCAYLCPRASCSKGSRNGPCGGSHDGMCELQDKECLWARAYERLRYYGESEHMLDGSAVFANAKLEGTSSWANTFLGRDHYAVPNPFVNKPEAPPAAKPEAPPPKKE